MDEPHVERRATSAPPATVEPPETFDELGRRRAETERVAVEWAIDELADIVAEQGTDLDPMIEYARRSRKSLPDRHRRAYDAMAEAFDVDRELYDVYVFAYAELCEALADGPGRTEKHPAGASAGLGCTNVLVSPEASAPSGPVSSTRSGSNLTGATGTDSTAPAGTDSFTPTGPLVLKNRDISGRGCRPKSVIEQPPIEGCFGLLTVDTCGTVSIFKGVNDRGLVAANTQIESERDDVDPEEQRRNGTIIRELLEECATVEAARRSLDSVPTRRLGGQTLFLADETDAVVLEIDPVTETIAADEGPVATRTNHFVYLRSTQTESSTTRRERTLDRLGGEKTDRPTPVDRGTLWELAADHAHGPGDRSVCRHPEPETDEPHAFGQLTTASAAVFEGGTPEIEFLFGNPCERTPTRAAFGDELPRAYRSGERWLASQPSDVVSTAGIER
ncbi:C45 family autoproteolytic acyltransferase/hydolase [Halovivax gelatinilyticus]|uniref:C45 family autoproteolytic acyltransferase/hydolase n=1 Tax=Halovivax gelatinilyticus TaxID=2961597 RepID=UPI0020CA69C1|nr:C45 family autoproteolytic acyltransferase/hydolase [Halovivax gelatinilyticus]